MLLREDLLRKKGVKRLHIDQIEKDYLLEHCMGSLSDYREALIFKGGTALYKFYGLNRFSEDLDFVQNKRYIDYERLKDRVVRDCAASGIGAQSGIVEAHQKGTTVRLYFRGPLYNGNKQSLCGIKLDFSHRERPLSTEIKTFTSFYDDVASFDLHVMGMEEILLEKIRAIMTRDKPRDVFDLWFLLRKGANIDPRFLEKKLKIYKETFSVELFLGRIERMRLSWKRDLSRFVIGELPEFDRAVEEIKQILEKTQ